MKTKYPKKIEYNAEFNVIKTSPNFINLTNKKIDFKKYIKSSVVWKRFWIMMVIIATLTFLIWLGAYQLSNLFTP